MKDVLAVGIVRGEPGRQKGTEHCQDNERYPDGERNTPAPLDQRSPGARRLKRNGARNGWVEGTVHSYLVVGNPGIEDGVRDVGEQRDHDDECPEDKGDSLYDG